MKIKDIKLLVFLFLSTYLIACNSGEYDLEQIQVEYVQKTLKYDTIQTSITDTVVKKQDIDNNKLPKETFTFLVQVGAFREPDNFQRFYDNAKIKLGEEVYYIVINELYKIRIGNYKNKSDALKMLEDVKSKGYFDAFIITVITK
jgi:cell division protein FtsN